MKEPEVRRVAYSADQLARMADEHDRSGVVHFVPDQSRQSLCGIEVAHPRRAGAVNCQRCLELVFTPTR